MRHVASRRGADELADDGFARDVQRDAEDDEPLVPGLLVDALPDRQVVAAASPRGPAVEEHLFPAIVGEGVHVPLEIRKREVGGLDAGRCRRRRRRTESPDAVRGVRDGWLPKVLRERGEVDPPGALVDPLLPGGNRDTDLAEADASRLPLPARRSLEVGEGEPESAPVSRGAGDPGRARVP